MPSRITVRLDEDLVRQPRDRARAQNVTLASLFNRAIREWLQSTTKPIRRERFVQTTYNPGQPLIDITHTNAAIDDLEDEERFQKMNAGK
jgi:hypothetical protein